MCGPYGPFGYFPRRETELTASGYALRFKDGELLPFTTATPQGVINVILLLLRLSGMTHEQAEDFFEDMEIVEVTVSMRTVEVSR